MKEVNFFDRFANRASSHVAKAWFFCLCVLIILLWLPTLFLLEINTSQLIINTLTTIITFLLVALLQNDQQRFEDSTNRKLNAQNQALAFLVGQIDLNNDLQAVRQKRMLILAVLTQSLDE